MLKWKRKVRLTISGAGGGAVFEGSQAPEDGFKIDFSVKKTLGSKQNSGTVTIWNLTKSNREKLGEEFKKLTLEVGYEDGGMAVLVEADIRDVEHDKSSPDISSQISFGDGDKGMNKGAVSKTFPKGTKPKEVIQHVVQQMPGVELGKIKGLDDLPAYKRPVSVYGWAFRALDGVGREQKLYWNIDRGKLNIVKNDEHLGQCAVISKETGMIGVPQWMPAATMKRVILHWTAGAHKASVLDMSHYHVLIEDDGRLVRGKPSIFLNDAHGAKAGYAAHTLNCNTGSIGVSLCCMVDALESPFRAGSAPMTRTQWEQLPRVVADLCQRYQIPVTPLTVLSHAEVQANLGIKQRGKWDISRLAFDLSVVGAKACGDALRKAVAALL